MGKCCRGRVVKRSVVETRWRSVAVKCCRKMMWRSVVEELWRGVVL